MLWTHSHIVFVNSAHVMHFRICCATILVIFCPLNDFVKHRHITYYTQSTVCQGGFSNKFLSSIVHGRMQDLPRGPTNGFFWGGVCLFATFFSFWGPFRYFLLHGGGVFGLPPPTKISAAPMIARRVREHMHASRKFVCVTAI